MALVLTEDCADMMTMKLWKPIDIALPMIVILVAQMILMALFGIFITSCVMGKQP